MSAVASLPVPSSKLNDELKVSAGRTKKLKKIGLSNKTSLSTILFVTIAFFILVFSGYIQHDSRNDQDDKLEDSTNLITIPTVERGQSSISSVSPLSSATESTAQETELADDDDEVVLLVTKAQLSQALTQQQYDQTDVYKIWSQLEASATTLNTELKRLRSSSTASGDNDNDLTEVKRSLFGVTNIIYLFGSGILVVVFITLMYFFWLNGLALSLLALCYGCLFYTIAEPLLSTPGQHYITHNTQTTHK